MDAQGCPVVVSGAQCGQGLRHVGTVRGKDGAVVKLMECTAGHRVIVEDSGQKPREPGH